MDAFLLIALGVFPVLVIVGGLNDLTTMKIPNWISLALVGAFLPAALLVGAAPMDIAVHVGVGLAALIVGMGMFALNWIGGGDAKLLAASCLWMGLSGVAPFLLWTGIAGGAFCLFLMTARQYFPMVAPSVSQGWVVNLMQPKGDIPYGVAIAIGALMALPESGLVIAFASGR
ncbi:Type IV leader peptidase family protein [Brevundimonas sp. SH203]|uniref:A24 family peptidase n=1 Tax=Brevundimonas sp. SH203 TaxID=345167 RepID=UPI0009C9CFFD|nr:prepilin peptidase [Brevundimonas sp. SH203]GAW41901.1 Type IV leader peptidase family protein [Brevundimonas sp. SH203]